MLRIGNSGSERIVNYRKKLKENAALFDVYKAKNRERKQVKRQVKKILSPGEVASLRQRKLNKERVAKHRQFEFFGPHSFCMQIISLV